MPRFLASIFKPFTLPSADMVALHEYENAKRELLAAHSAREYAQAMVDYNEVRVQRLHVYINRLKFTGDSK